MTRYAGNFHSPQSHNLNARGSVRAKDRQGSHFAALSVDESGMQRQNYMIELATPRGFRGGVFSHADVAAQRKMTRQLLRQFTAEIRPLKQRDPAMRIRKRPNAAMPLFLINTIPALRSPIGELKSVRSVNELKRLHLIR